MNQIVIKNILAGVAGCLTGIFLFNLGRIIFIIIKFNDKKKLTHYNKNASW
jgi:hypothetical protein